MKVAGHFIVKVGGKLKNIAQQDPFLLTVNLLALQLEKENPEGEKPVFWGQTGANSKKAYKHFLVKR